MDIYHKVLNQYWGFTKFRPLQHDIICSVGQGNDTLALMPTGGGKSITFQVPALATDGLCIVITPLIALMTDQVENLKKRGIKATAIYSGMSKHEIDIALENCVHDPNQKFLYCSPERIGTEIFRTRVRQMNVNLLAIDESHCISQWGYDFRPSYMKITELRDLLPNVPVLAVTATATPEVVDDIQNRLGFKQKNVLSKSFERKNLVYLVRQTEDKQKLLLKIAESIKGTGIVYARNRKNTKEIAQFLHDNGHSADYYHAGLETPVRQQKQSDWKQGRTRIMVATNAFGMGIDKPDVRFVIHVDMPDNLEAYFQEAGRAGRDEKQAFAVLLYHPSDKTKLEQRIEASFPPIDDIRRVYDALGNFFQIPVGAGKNISYDFNLALFVKNYKLSILLVHNCLHLLQNSGYLEASEDVDNPSKLIFLVNRDDLYKYQVANANEDLMIKLLLRTYEGLFSEYKPIYEEDLALKAGVTRQVIYNYLVKLSRDKIINYIPQKKGPQIFYTEERLEAKSLLFTPEKYHQRKERYINRVNAVIKYATHHKCRSQQLLNYFGDANATRCGVCDVCTLRNELGLSQYEFDLALKEIKTRVQSAAVTIDQLVEAIPQKPEKTTKVIRWLLDNHKLVKLTDQTLVWQSE